jgi:putative OPT family oligopeptide transporter
MLWTLITALLGVLMAVPMKKQMINKERLPFPTGIAAAETLRSLHGGSKESIKKAYSLVTAMVIGAMTGIASKGKWAWQQAIHFQLPDDIKFPLIWSGCKMDAFPGFGFEPSLMLISAGMIVGLRVSLSMLISSCVLYFGFAPWLMEHHIISSPAKLLSGWALWTGTSIMVGAGLTSFAMQWKTIARAFMSMGKPGGVDEQGRELAEMERRTEVPTKWFIIGVIPVGLAFTILEYYAFHIDFYLGVLSVVMSFFLALVACRATGETDITPISAMGKITQLTFAILKPHNMTANLMAASVTANTASASADLLQDLKSGYLLGANARKQFLAQLCGVFFGTITIVPAWFLMIPNKEVLESYQPPMTLLYKAVAEALSNGIEGLPESARAGIIIGLLLGTLLTVLETLVPKLRKFLPSPMGLGLAWVMPFKNCLSFCIGALIAWVWSKLHEKSAEAFTVPVASGAIAGESLACAFVAILQALVVLHFLK